MRLNHQEKKRDSCVIQEASDLAAHFLTVVSKTVSMVPSKPVPMVASKPVPMVASKTVPMAASKVVPMVASKTVPAILILEAASSLASFSGSVFGFQSPSGCDLDVKLDKILV